MPAPPVTSVTSVRLDEDHVRPPSIVASSPGRNRKPWCESAKYRSPTAPSTASSLRAADKWPRSAQCAPPSWVTLSTAHVSQPLRPSTQPWDGEMKLAAAGSKAVVDSAD